MKGNSRRARSAAPACNAILADRRGAAAVIITMMLPIMIAGLAMAVDSFNNRIVFSRLQAAADAAALDGLEAVAADGSATSAALSAAHGNLPENYGDAITAADVTVGQFTADGQFLPGDTPDANAVMVQAVRANARANGVRQIVSGFFGRPFADVRATAIAARPINTFYDPPEAMNLDNEAGDFNELYAYCFNHSGSGPAAARRSKMTLIANNLPVGTNVSTFTYGVITATPDPVNNWPRCDGENESLSFRLRNIRHAKSHRTLWTNPNATIEGRKPGRPEFNHFTDTKIDGGLEVFQPGLNVLETVLCDSIEQCNPGVPGHIIPRGKNRTPVRASQPCQPGKFMYFGWEDRPPGQPGANSHWMDPAWTDRDFDDIVILMRCPRSGKLGESKVRLVR